MIGQIDTKGIDYTTLAQVIGAASGTTVPTELPEDKPNPYVAIFKEVLANPALMTLLIGLIGGLFKKKPKPAEPAPPVVVTPPAPPAPPVTPPAPPVPPRRPRPVTITGLRSRYLLIENGSHQIVGKGEFDAIRDGSQPVGHGYRIHIDLTPEGADGQPFFNDDLPKYPDLFAIDPAKVAIDERNGHYTCGEGNNRIEHHLVLDGKDFASGDTLPGQTWDGQDAVFLTSEYDDAAMTPVITVSRDLDLKAVHKLAYYAVWVGPNGERVQSNSTPTITVHAWGE